MDITNQALAAFMGAFFAFLFVRIGEMLSKLYDRQVKNYNGLIEIEYFCIENIDTVANNIKIIEDINSILIPALAMNQPVVCMNRLHTLIFIEDILFKLNSIDFINKLLSFKIDLGRINSDINMLNDMSDDFKNSLVEGRINFETYKINMQSFLKKLNEFKKFLKSVEKDMVGIAGCAKILAQQRKPLFTKVIHLICCKRAFSASFDKKVAAEIIQIEKDRAENSKKSKEKIDGIQAQG
jgi:hypothetical protein